MMKIHQIQNAVAQHYGVSVGRMLGPTRSNISSTLDTSRCGSRARKTGASLPEIGRAFNRDHTTVLAALRKIYLAMALDPSFRDDVENLARCSG